MDRNEMQKDIAARVAVELKDGQYVNLGIGLPTYVPNYIPPGVTVMLHAENGFIGMGPAPDETNFDSEIVNAGGQPSSILPGGAFFDSATSFGIARGGHLDVTVLGALQVDEKGDIANYMIPGKMVPGMGGAMDLLVGAKQVIVAMEHTAKGSHKILQQCNLPLTAKGVVDLIITEMAVIKVTDEGLVLTEVRNGYTVEDVQSATEAKLIVKLA
jgi:acetate CoA/acetoacetate CoA-transferase beta subunit